MCGSRSRFQGFPDRIETRIRDFTNFQGGSEIPDSLTGQTRERFQDIPSPGFSGRISHRSFSLEGPFSVLPKKTWMVRNPKTARIGKALVEVHHQKIMFMFLVFSLVFTKLSSLQPSNFCPSPFSLPFSPFRIQGVFFRFAFVTAFFNSHFQAFFCRPKKENKKSSFRKK